MVALKSFKAQNEVLESDVKIIDVSTITGNIIKYPAELMPDGEEFTGQLPPDGINNELLQIWCGNVRSQWNVRQTSKNAKETSVSETNRDAGTGEDTPTTGRGELQETAQKDISAGEVSLSEFLKIRESFICAAMDLVEEQQEETLALVATYNAAHDRLCSKREELEDELNIVQEMMNDTPTNS